MNKESFNALLEVFQRRAQGNTKPSIFTGTVCSTSPLTVQCAGLLLTARDLLVNERFLQPSATRVDHLTAGCRVALVSADLDTFILLCKVVKP